MLDFGGMNMALGAVIREQWGAPEHRALRELGYRGFIELLSYRPSKRSNAVA